MLTSFFFWLLEGALLRRTAPGLYHFHLHQQEGIPQGLVCFKKLKGKESVIVCSIICDHIKIARKRKG